MSNAEILKHPAKDETPRGVELGSIEFRGDSTFTAVADIGVVSGETLMCVSLACDHTHARAAAAILQSPALKCRIRMGSPLNEEGRQPVSPYLDLDRHKGGYRCSYHRLGYQTWHMVAVARCPELVLPYSEEMAWRCLSGPAYTTPILRRWMPAILDFMKENRKLQMCKAFGVQAGMIHCSQQHLDEIVSHLLKERKVTI